MSASPLAARIRGAAPGAGLGGRTRSQARQAATHEAAHAVAALAFGWQVERVSIAPGNERVGGAWLHEREGDQLALAAERAVVAMVADLALLSFAAADPARYALAAAPPISDEGLEEIVSSALPAECVSGYTARSDLERAERAVLEVGLSTDERAALLSFARARARSLLAQPRFVARVELLAEALLARTELSGAQVDEVLAGA